MTTTSTAAATSRMAAMVTTGTNTGMREDDDVPEVGLLLNDGVRGIGVDCGVVEDDSVGVREEGRGVCVPPVSGSAAAESSHHNKTNFVIPVSLVPKGLGTRLAIIILIMMDNQMNILTKYWCNQRDYPSDILYPVSVNKGSCNLHALPVSCRSVGIPYQLYPGCESSSIRF